MVTLCFRFSLSSIIFQVAENEILQNQECVKNAKFDNSCVIENANVSRNILIALDVLKFCNAMVSIIAGDFNDYALWFFCAFLHVWSAGFCIRFHVDQHSLQMVHRNMVVAPRDIVNKNILIAAIDTFITGLFVPPFNSFDLIGVQNIRGTSYVRIEYWVTIMSFFKLIWAFRFVLQSCLENFADSIVLRKLAHFDPGILFAVKLCVFKFPLFFLGCCWLLLFVMAAYIVRIVEAPSNNNVLPLSQTLWLCLSAFTTVGYGDIVPKSHLGRFVLAVGVCAAYLLISLSVVTWRNYISLKYSEKGIVKVYQYSLMKGQLRNAASRLISRWLKIVLQKKKGADKKWTVHLYWAMLEEVLFA